MLALPVEFTINDDSREFVPHGVALLHEPAAPTIQSLITSENCYDSGGQ
jgi:hypothetical protein